MKNVLFPACNTIIAGLCLVALPASAQLKQAISAGEQATKRAEQIQDQINQLDDKRNDLEGEYRSMLQRLDAAKLFAAQQKRVVASQEEELASLEDQLGRVDEITAQMTPMMLDMITDLETFVAADMPFRLDERQLRLEQLNTAMDSADVAPAERYRLIVEAYQAEMEYGRTINTFEGTITNEAGESIAVQMFQYGRVALVYYNPANGDVARWNRNTRAWEALPAKYRRPIQDAIRIAEGTKQTDILKAPVEKFEVTAE